MASPRVSICVPTYNRAAFLRECLRSILEQTFQDYELLVVDNASADDTPAVVRAFRDPRLRYYRNDRNLGMTPNWNRCLALASGEYVCIFHDDDLMLPTNLEEKVAVLDAHPDVGLVYSDVAIIDVHGQSISKGDRPACPQDRGVILQDGFQKVLSGEIGIWPSTAVVRRRCYGEVGPFDESLRFVPDIDMWARIAMRYPLALIRRPLVKYRGHDGNMSKQLATVGEAEQDRMRLLVKYFEDPRLAPLLKGYRRRAYYAMHMNDAGMYLTAQRLGDARRSYLKALRCRPLKFLLGGSPPVRLFCAFLGWRAFVLARRLRALASGRGA